MKTKEIHIIGAGLAGSEAAYFLATLGHRVHLHEMRPMVTTEAHKTSKAAELVCSNSLKSKAPGSAPALLKDEMRRMGSLVLKVADQHSVPGGDALTVDRDLFSSAMDHALRSHPNITWVSGEVTEPIPGAINLLATGPLTSPKLTEWLGKATGEDQLYFYDAIAPIIDAKSIDWDHAFIANRYGKGGEEAYVNCPLTEQEYNSFYDALMSAEQVVPKNFEKEKFFQGCQPIEAIAATGKNSLRFGAMKPVGLNAPGTEKKHHAVIQLRPENRSKTAYNMVGFQTKLKWGEQTRIFRMIPALRNAEFLRLGSIHRNTFVCSPKALRADLSLKKNPDVYCAGQITGVEGYLESSACGLLAGLFIAQKLEGLPISAPPATTAIGALLSFLISSPAKNFQPNNIQFGLFETLLFRNMEGLKKDAIREQIAIQTQEDFSSWSSTQRLLTNSGGESRISASL